MGPTPIIRDSKQDVRSLLRSLARRDILPG
jgi:hypothetical protein